MTAPSAVPKVVGPLTGGQHGWPFGCPIEDVAARGYVMEEFVLEGQAVSYRIAAGGSAPRDGRWDAEPADTAAYATRAYVVRPADPAAFNGVAIVNWQNVTAGLDLGAPLNDETFRGYAWIGVTAQKIGVDGIAGQTRGLRAWDPDRYGALHHPGDAWSYDIFSQAGRLVRGGTKQPGIDILGGLEPRIVLAAGGSQSAMRLGSYLNAVHQRDRVFDGFHLTVHWGICPPLEERALTLMEMFQPTDDALSPGACAIRDDGRVPIMLVATECEARFNHPVRQADTDTFRFWEIAGAAHQSTSPAALLAQIMTRDGIVVPAAEPDRNAIDWRYVNDAALRALTGWARHGQVPPSMPRIEMADAARPTILRDAYGNARGGVRLPELEAPVATYLGEREGGASSPSWLQGQTTPLPREQRAKLYPTDQARAQAWNAAVDRLVEQGLVLAEDVALLRARGGESIL